MASPWDALAKVADFLTSNEETVYDYSLPRGLGRFVDLLSTDGVLDFCVDGVKMPCFRANCCSESCSCLLNIYYGAGSGDETKRKNLKDIFMQSKNLMTVERTTQIVKRTTQFVLVVPLLCPSILANAKCVGT